MYIGISPIILTYIHGYCIDLHDGKTAGAMSDGTQVFSQIEQGDLSDADQLPPLVCDELRALVCDQLRKSPVNKNDTKIAWVGSSGDCPGSRGMRSTGEREEGPALGLPGVLLRRGGGRDAPEPGGDARADAKSQTRTRISTGGHYRTCDRRAGRRLMTCQTRPSCPGQGLRRCDCA